MNRAKRAGLLSLLLVFVVGCAAAPQVVEEPRPEAPTELTAGIWDVRNGEQVELEEFFSRLGEARFVLVGESHGDTWHHEAQQAVYAALTERRPGQVMLGMEMVEQRFQDALDDYVAGRIDENDMLHAVEWDERWRIDYRNYAPLWRLARRHEQPVVGLNAPRELVRKVGQVGLEGLSDAEQAALPDIDLSNEAYRERLRRIFEAHDMGKSEEDLDRFFQAQVLWDETMAETAFEELQREEGAQMVLVVGRGHMERGHGIPSRLVRRSAAPEEVVTVVPVTTQGPRAVPMERYLNLEYLQSEQIADYVWVQ